MRLAASSGQCRPRPQWLIAVALVSATCEPASHAVAQDLNLNPTRPTVSNSSGIQGQGVLQVETGYDAYPGSQGTVQASFFYTPLASLRLDFSWSAFQHQVDGPGVVTDGVGDIQIGGKVVVYREQYHRAMPGIAVQYETELPTAPQQSLQNYGQQAILLINHHYGKEGDLDVIVNGSIVQSNCGALTGCSYGGQQSAAVSYHIAKTSRLYAEVFGQNNSDSNTPPGTYAFGGFYHQFSDTFGIDGGMRFGVSSGSSRVGTTVGLVFGKRLQGEASPEVRPTH